MSTSISLAHRAARQLTHVGLMRLGPFDAIVVGAGLAGCAAALRAQELGCRTLLLDKSDVPSSGSNTVLSGGNLHLAYSPLQAPTRELRLRIEEATWGGGSSRSVVNSLLRGRHRALRWLEEIGIGLERDPGAAWRLWLAPYQPLISISSWQGRGPDRALAVMRSHLAAAGGVIAGGATALELLRSNAGGVAGAVLRIGKTSVAVRAPHVVLADGGFQANREMVSTHIGRFADRIVLRAADTATGDGLRMSRQLRGGMSNLSNFYGHLLHRKALVDRRLYPYPELDTLLSTGILVTREGARIADEGLGGVAMANIVARLDDPTETWIVADDAGWTSAFSRPRAKDVPYADPIRYFETCHAETYSSPTIADLADVTTVNAMGLATTIDAFNAGYDVGALQRSAVPRTRVVGPLRRPPFHAVPVVPGITFTMGGPLIDYTGNVLDLDGVRIPGLFAVGSTIGGLQGGPRGGYIGGLAPALILGVIVGEQLARHTDARRRRPTIRRSLQ